MHFFRFLGGGAAACEAGGGARSRVGGGGAVNHLIAAGGRVVLEPDDPRIELPGAPPIHLERRGPYYVIPTVLRDPTLHSTAIEHHAALGSGGNETIRHKLTGATALLTSALATMSTLGCARD